MRIDVLTIFPGIFDGPLDHSLMLRARARELIGVSVHDLRDYTDDAHRTTDDYPFGGGPGMVLKPEPIFRAVESLRGDASRVILLTPQGRLLDHGVVRDLSAERHLILICGRYEGVDERVREAIVDDEISIGDYVLTGGELPALVLIDAVARWVPGVVGEPSSVEQDSFSAGLLEGPHYTRPRRFAGLDVPEVLLSGHHERIRRWRRREALRRTLERRPELLGRATLSDEDRLWLAELRAERGQ